MTIIEPGNQPDPVDDAAELSRRERAKLEDENRSLRVQMLVQGQGLDPTKGVGKLFVEGYKGEPNEDAIKASIAEHGIAPAPVEPIEPAPTGDITEPGERQQTIDRQTAAAGNVPDGGTPSQDPRVTAVAAGKENLEVGGTLESSMGVAFDHIAAAAYGGVNPDGSTRAPDKRAQWWPGKEDPRRPDLGW